MSTIKTVPSPKEVRLEKGEFSINEQTTILLGESHAKADEFAAGLLQEDIPATTKVFSPSPESKNVIVLSIFGRDEKFRHAFCWQDALFDERLKEEGYSLSITPERIIIGARTEAGLFYGVHIFRT